MDTKLKRKEDLKLLYYRYKDTMLFSALTTSLIIIVALFLVWKIVVPQLQSWFSIQEEVKVARVRIESLEANQAYINNLSNTQLDNNFLTAAAALPFEKDFLGILNAVNASTIATGIILDDYSFQVGNLSTKSAQLSQENNISVKLNVQGSLETVENFLTELYKKVPLTEVVEIDYSNGGSTISLLFYYKILPGELKIIYANPLSPIDAESATLLRELEQWQEESESVADFGAGFVAPISSESATTSAI